MRNFRRYVLSLLILLLSFSAFIFGQTDESDKENSVIIPDQAMEQIVRRVLIWRFKPRNKKKIIYLAKGEIQKSWLPRIEGVEFQLLSAVEIEKQDGVHFFAKLEQISKNKYQIGFAFGDPNCHFIGDTWSFRLSKQRVKLWKDGGGFGQDCSGDSFPSTNIFSPKSRIEIRKTE